MCPIITLGGRGKHCFYLMKDLFLQKQCSIQVINTPSRKCRVHSKHMEIKSNDAQKTTEGGIQELVCEMKENGGVTMN